MPSRKLYPRTALALLTALNLLNYIDRSVLFAVQPLVQTEFHLTKTQLGYLTSAFLAFYMVAAPFAGPLADRYSRKVIIVLGAFFWSGLTLLTAVTHTYWELLLRHTLVGIGEATFVTIAPSLVADLFPENVRGRIFGIFYLAIPVGTAAGYIVGGKLGPSFGWRYPFYVAALPGFLLALALLFIPEPPRGQYDTQKETPQRGTLLGLARNPAFLTVTLGMAAGTFSLGGIQVWMPTFLSSARGYSLEAANLMFGKIVVVAGIVASLAGGWIGDWLLPQNEKLVLFRLRPQHGSWRSRDDRRLVQPGTIHDARHRPFCVSSSAEHFAAQHGAGQFRRRAHSRHRHRRQYFYLSSSRRRAFSDADGLWLPTGILSKPLLFCRLSRWPSHLPYCFTECDLLPKFRR